MLLDPGNNLTLRPMAYPRFFDMYRHAIQNTWTVEEVDFSTDLADLDRKMTGPDRHLVERLVAFFATGDTIVANNLALNLYRHINAPEARLYLSRQLYEEALHVQFYLTLLDTYLPDPASRARAFAAVETIPSIRRKAEFCLRWMGELQGLDALDDAGKRRRFLLNLIGFACCVEGLFFFAAFAYVYYLRSRGLLHGLAAGTSWVFRDESAHMAFAFEVARVVRQEEPHLFDRDLIAAVHQMLDEAIACESQFAEDLLSGGVVGLSSMEMRQYLEYIADQRLVTLGLPRRYGARNPFPFMDLQDVHEVTNFSSAGSRPTGSASPARSPSTSRSEQATRARASGGSPAWCKGSSRRGRSTGWARGWRCIQGMCPARGSLPRGRRSRGRSGCTRPACRGCGTSR